jgi:uncharacterized protein involved in high-affinity Fe2+ transport
MLNVQNYLIKSLAVVGTISLIIMACSVDNANDTNSTNSTANTNVVGRYQVSSYINSSLNTRYFDVIDTETGIVKSYYKSGATPGNYLLDKTTITQ